jgi:prevent-host-death family protein
MKLSSQIKPISYLKAHAAEIVRTMGEQGAPLVITQNGEAKVVLQDIESYEQTQETMALLKVLALETAFKDIKSKGQGQKAKIKNGKDRRDGGGNGIF